MKRSRLRKVSKGQSARLREYRKLRAQFLTEYPICQICNNERATDVHHQVGRIGWRLNDPKYYKALCSLCHMRVETDRQWARDMGFSLDRLTNK